MTITKERLNELNKDSFDGYSSSVIYNDELDEVFALARLGLWARDFAIPSIEIAAAPCGKSLFFPVLSPALRHIEVPLGFVVLGSRVEGGMHFHTWEQVLQMKKMHWTRKKIFKKLMTAKNKRG